MSSTAFQVCDECGATVVDLDAHRFSKHGERKERETRACGVCGEQFEPKKRDQQYCGKTCAGFANANGHTEDGP